MFLNQQSMYASTNPDTIKAIEEISQSARERIAFIEFILYFHGVAMRTDLTNFFGIAPAQATKDFAFYAEYAPENIIYDKKKRIHRRSLNFKPIFNFDVNKILALITNSFFSTAEETEYLVDNSYRISTPRIDIIASITEAIYHNNALKISYSSVIRDTERVIIPHSIVDNGLRWHVRAYDRETGGFRDFCVTRIFKAKVIPASNKQEDEGFVALNFGKAYDRSWNTKVTVEVVPHPDNIPNSRAIELDYNMVNGKKRLELRAAIVPYLLRMWAVDASLDHRLRGNEYQLWLSNGKELMQSFGSEEISIQVAPGGQDLADYRDKLLEDPFIKEKFIKAEKEYRFKASNNFN